MSYMSKNGGAQYGRTHGHGMVWREVEGNGSDGSWVKYLVVHTVVTRHN